ncbi:TlyA family RNA methyltransferase [Chloroflexota bacterium]
MKKRIDNLLLDRNYVESRAKAQGLIMAGEVAVNGKTIIKSGTLVAEDAEITLTEPPPFVSRGGIKLNYALDRFGTDVSLKTIADIGASTGGFTDCLLKRGASRVYAIDVGYGQLDYRLRKDPRVTVMERQNARYPVELPERVDMVTMDVSFISVEKIIPSVVKLLKEDGCLIVMLKPQFEARKKEVGKGGVIRQPVMHARVLGRFITWVTKQDLRLKSLAASPILGGSGNREFFVLLNLT